MKVTAAAAAARYSAVSYYFGALRQRKDLYWCCPAVLARGHQRLKSICRVASILNLSHGLGFRVESRQHFWRETGEIPTSPGWADNLGLAKMPYA